MLRAVARGWEVSVIQFMKSGRWRVGEETVARQLGIDWAATGDGFSWLSDDLERSSAGRRGLGTGPRCHRGRHHLVVLDEITYLMNWGWIPSAEVAKTIRDRPAHVNVIATGRDAPDELLEADTIPPGTKVRHARHGCAPGEVGLLMSLTPCWAEPAAASRRSPRGGRPPAPHRSCSSPRVRLGTRRWPSGSPSIGPHARRPGRPSTSRLELADALRLAGGVHRDRRLPVAVGVQPVEKGLDDDEVLSAAGRCGGAGGRPSR